MCQHDHTEITECVKKDLSENSSGKALCGTCGHKAKGKNIWICTLSPAFKDACPAPDGACPGFSQKPFRKKGTQGGKKNGLPVPPGVKLLYFGHRSILMGKHMGARGHHGIVTVAWIESSPGTLHLGFSFCSPKDPWCKTTGRDIALTRLLHPVVIPCLYDARRTVHEIARAIMSHDFKRLAAIAPGVTMWGMIPSWTKGLAEKMWPETPEATEFSKTLSYKLLTMRRSHPPRPLITFISTPRQVNNLFSKYCVDESATISPEVWETKNWEGFGCRPGPYTALDILTRMAVDIAGLGRAAE
jgi:hypothetical protein